MAIPYGLLSQTEIEKKKRGPFKEGEGYWLGNQFVFPQFPAPSQGILPKSLSPAPAATPASLPPETYQPPVYPQSGDGVQGEGFGGGRDPNTGPGANAGMSPDTAAGMPQATKDSLPGLPAFNAPEPTAPAPGLAPSPGLAMPGLDPNENGATPSGKSPGKGLGTGKGFSVSPGTLSPEQVSQALGTATPVAPQKDLFQEFKDLGIFGSPSVVSFGGTVDPATVDPAPDISGDMGGGDPAGTSAGTPDADQSGASGVFRKGGLIPMDADAMLEAVPITAHEGEFVLKPEAAKYYGKGILGALNAQKIPKAKLSGLLGALGR